jgi:peptidoglycan/xylan/chitin deacetylase (PgdA/CDA1 family)
MLFLSVLATTKYPPQNTLAPAVAEWTKVFLSRNVNSLPVISKCVAPSDWALTFDDGPSPFTSQILEALKKRNLKATFFVIGSAVQRHPDILRDIYNAGHQIGIHTWAHKALTNLTNELIISELTYCANAIYDVLGVTPTIYRPPFGLYDSRVVATTSKMGLQTVYWNRDTRDAGGSTSVVASFMSWAKSKIGAVSLAHDTRQEYVSQSIDAMDIVPKNGFEVKPLTPCAKLSASYYSTALIDVKPADFVKIISDDSSTGNSPPAKTTTPQVPSKTPNSANTKGFFLLAAVLLQLY